MSECQTFIVKGRSIDGSLYLVSLDPSGWTSDRKESVKLTREQAFQAIKDRRERNAQVDEDMIIGQLDMIGVSP